jgi:hypothetical protein
VLDILIYSGHGIIRDCEEKGVSLMKISTIDSGPDHITLPTIAAEYCHAHAAL